MDSKEARGSDGSGSKSKRPRQENVDLAQEEEGLLALVNKRKRDVKLLEARILTVRTELHDSKTKLALAETLLETMRSGRSSKQSENGNVRQKADGKASASKADGKACGARTGASTSTSSEKAMREHSTEEGRRAKGDSSGRSKYDIEKKENKERLGKSATDVEKEERDTGDGKTVSEASRKDQKSSNVAKGPQESKREKKEQNEGADRNKLQLGKEAKACSTSDPAQRGHTDLITKVKSQKKADVVALHAPLYSPCRHRRKMRSLILNPDSENQCATSGLDGLVNFWQIHSKGLDINHRYGVDCLSPGQRHWPEDMTWHPEGHSIFAVYTADHDDSQVSIIKNDSKNKVATFLPAKPHVKGIMNAISFMPWSNSQFVTGGNDHLVVLWMERSGGVWKPKVLHEDLHSSAVMGVAGTRHKQLVLSAGCDKRVFGFDPVANKMAFHHQLETKAISVLPNTSDFNLFMVQTGTPRQQLHLYDIRSNSELHNFGWVQESSDTQSALFSQSWSPDGFYTASGSNDPKIPIFDIRFNGREPAQTILAHTKRVFTAAWHYTLPMILSISSDLTIGVHRIYR